MESPRPFKSLSDFELPLTNYNLNGENGRVNLTVRKSAGGSAPSDFPGYQYQRSSEENFQDDMLRGNWEPTDVTKIYFSKENLDRIQNAIRRQVFERSQPKGYIIDNQSADELKMIMRAMFLAHSQNRPDHVREQIQELNNHVFNYCIPRIYGEAQGYLKYLQDASTLVVPMSNPIHVSMDKTLELKPFF